jgi:phage shock protein A
MITIAIRVREIVSSNVDTLVSKAGEPRKMLRLLQSEIEETLIALHGDVAKARRQSERLRVTADRVATAAEEWTAKAKVAIDHGREDLARAALLARESDRAKAAAERDAAGKLEQQVSEAEAIIADLDEKREAIALRLAELAKEAVAAAAETPSAVRAMDHRLDRIDALERRAAFADSPDAAPSHTSLDDEIAGLQQQRAIEAELAAMKGGAAPKRSGGKKRS